MTEKSLRPEFNIIREFVLESLEAETPELLQEYDTSQTKIVLKLTP